MIRDDRDDREDNLTGVVLNIQRFSLNDGPGIRTTVFMKGCMMRCKWCQNPESFKKEPEIGFHSSRCINCYACFEVCPQKAIRKDKPYRINSSSCNMCGSCIMSCPVKALVQIGQYYTVDQLHAEVLRDSVFYEESGGGITISGGESTMQFDFILAFLKKCKDSGLNTLIETNGYTTTEGLTKLLPYLDLIYFDIKIINEEDHYTLTGVNNKRILENVRWLTSIGAPVVYRLPLIPGMTLTKANISAMIDFLKELSIKEIELIPYQNDWERKLSWLQTDHTPLNKPSLNPDEINLVIREFKTNGINACTA